jgi:glucose/arabinose dehydrogenase
MNKIISAVLFFMVLIPSFADCAQKVGGIPQEVEDVFLPDIEGIKVEPWVENLEVPWSLVFLPDKRALVSERPGRIRLIKAGKIEDKPYAKIEVHSEGEAGLLGLAVHPEFPNQPFIYAMYTYEKGGDLFNRVVRFKDDGDTGTFDKVIWDDLPGARFHDGGRIAFGPDKMLYITIGENFKAKLAQDLTSLGGKILRMTPDGQIPADNPFKGSPVYTYGNRNPQGLAWQPETGKLFESEHGPTGEFAHFGHDEINIILKGGNYGWPAVIGAPGEKIYIDPIIVWKKATPPAGMTFYQGELLKNMKGDLFVATLISEALIRISLNKDTEKVERIERWFAKDDSSGKYGRLRDVVEGPDGALYFTTSNRDGRGNPRAGDDKIYRISPKQ